MVIPAADEISQGAVLIAAIPVGAEAITRLADMAAEAIIRAASTRDEAIITAAVSGHVRTSELESAFRSAMATMRMEPAVTTTDLAIGCRLRAIRTITITDIDYRFAEPRLLTGGASLQIPRKLMVTKSFAVLPAESVT